MTNDIEILEFALLGLLQQQAQSGYDLRKTFSQDCPRATSAIARDRSTLRCGASKSAAGFPQNGENDSARKRQVYRITASGRSTDPIG